MKKIVLAVLCAAIGPLAYAAPLFVNETVWRFPDRNFALPAKRHPVHDDPIVDQRAQPNRNWTRGKDSKIQPGRRQRLKVCRIREKWKDFRDRLR